MMDILPTQVYENDSFDSPTQELSHSLLHNGKKEESQIGTLRIGSVTYPIKQGITKIGRHPQCDIILNDQTVSKNHAEIEVNGGETWICDWNSSNKTKLNSSVLRSGRYYELKGGSVIEFGMVRAVYSVLSAMDEPLIPETPDASMNCSSTSEDNVSMVPGTQQAEKGDSVFRRPSAPARSSVSSRKIYLPDSSFEDSVNASEGSSTLGKDNSGEKRVSTRDMEMQKSFDSRSNLCGDIHDLETQKICLDSFSAVKQSCDQSDIHDMETQHEEDVDTQGFVTDIHDVETQHDVDIDDLNTPRKTEAQNASIKGNEGASAVENEQTEGSELKVDVSMEAGKSEIKEEKLCTNAVYEPEEAIAAQDEDSGHSEQLENGQRGSQDCLELSIATNFDDEGTELDRSGDLLGSQNLLENLISDDDPAKESGSKSVSPLKSSANNDETTEKSSDEENIFDAATQANNENVPDGVTKRVDYTFKASLIEDDSDDDTDQEGVFQRYSRIASQDSSQGAGLSKSQSDSEDSDTDEEGHFTAMAVKEKRATSLSFEVRQNESKETKNDAGTSRDSDDIFEIVTQQVNLENFSKGQGDASKDSVDFDTPTQVIITNQPVNVAEKGDASFDTPTQLIEVNEPKSNVAEKDTSMDENDLMPTQMIDTDQPVNVTEKGDTNFDTPTQFIEVNNPKSNVAKNDTSMDEDDLMPTQMIDTDQPVNVTEKGDANFDTPTQFIEVNNPKSNVAKNDTSMDEDDLMPTQMIDTDQPVNVTEKGDANFDTPTQFIEVNDPKSNVAEKDTSMDEDDLMPTQMIDTNQPVNVTEKGGASFDTQTQLIEVNVPKSNVVEKDTNMEEDDLMPTQILPISEISRNVTAAAKGNTTRNEDKDEVEADYNTPTQIIAQKVSISNESISNCSERSNPQLVEEFSMEDIDYEMAPTQLLSDIEEKKKVALAHNKNKSRKFNRVNLDDTLERNLNEMFDDVNEDIEDDLPQMSTQILTNMLQSPQNKEESADVNIEKELPGSSKKNTSPRRTRSKSPAAKLEVSPLITSRKSRRSSLKKTITNNDSQNYFSNLTTTRKRNVLVDSEEFATISEDKDDTEFEKKWTNKTLNDENNISAALLKSSKNSSSTRLSTTNKAEELKVPEPVVKSAESAKGNTNVAEELDRGDESVDTGQSGHTGTLDSDEDIMAGLPEVKILGTLSNPASPTSSTSTEFRFTTRSMKPKSGAKKTELRKKVTPKKSTRRSVARTNAQNKEPPKLGRPRSTAFSSTFDASKVLVTICESDDDITNEFKSSNRRSSRKSKESGSLQTKRNSPHAELRHSPSIQSNGRTGGSSTENLDSSSVFQVGKEALIATEAELVRKTAVPKVSRTGKRSLSSTDLTESNDAKKRKVDVAEKTSVATKSRRSTRGVAATRSNSANILDYIMRRDSPVLNSDSSQQSVSSNQESFTTKQLKIQITRLSSDTLSPLSPLTPMGSAKEDDRASVNSIRSNSSKAENDKSTTVEEKVYLTRGNRSKRAASKRNVEDVSSQIGEESQEVEMIMNSWVKEQNINVNGKKQEETNKNTKGNRGRGAGECGHTSASTSEEITENTSSEVYESDNACFEIPTSKAKRAKLSKNTTNVGNTAANESTTRGRKNVRQSSRLTRGLQQSVADSSLEDTKEANDNETSVSNAASKENAPKKRGRKKKVQKEEAEENKSEVTIEETTFSDMNSSMDISAMSTPTRSRKSMNSSYATSSPHKIKHKILFTGITNEYSKLLAKLGSSQVEDPAKCTVLVTDKVRRTVKFLCALAQAVPIVSVNWLVDSEKAGHFTELDNYILKDPAAEAKFGFRLRGSLEKAKKQKLLDGYTILLTPNVAPPPVLELKSIVSSCGGKPLVRPPPSWPQNAVIISREEDMGNAKKFLAKAPKTVTVQSTEFILTGILRQELDFVKYKLT